MRLDVSVKLESSIFSIDRAREQIARAVERAALVAESEMKRSMTGPKSGREYNRGRTRNRRPHRASAPGEPPAVDSGTLLNSISTLPGGTEFEAVVTVGAEYGAYLEFGTRRMDPRPYVRPALEKARRALENDILGIVSG